MYPYHRTPVQHLLEIDYPLRVEFCNFFLRQINQDLNFVDIILWSDESTFTRSGVFNYHNHHTYAYENPHSHRVENFQHEFKVNVCAGMIGNKIIGPHFLPETTNGQYYADFVQTTLINMIIAADIEVDEIWFQQDEAPPHFAIVAREAVSAVFGNRWIGRIGRNDDAVRWPPRSPDLTPLDYFLWGHLKDEVYAVPIDDVDDLRHKIVAAFNRLKDRPEIITKAIQDIRRRCGACVERNGQQFEQFR